VNSALIKKDGIPSGSLAIVRDVTERKKAQQGFLESRQKFEGLFTANPEAAVYLGPDFHILDVNPRFTELFGYRLEDAKNKHINEVIVPKDKIEEAEMLDKKAIDGYVYRDTFRERKDGSLVPVSVSAAPIAVEGKLVGYVGVYKDISEQRLSEEKLSIMNEKLRVVGGLTRHDVRNKLASITGNVYLAKRRLAADDEVLDHLERIEESIQKVVEILDFARAYEMLGAEELVYIDLENTIEEAVSLFPGPLDAEIVKDCQGLTVLADSLLRQIFYNLIDNSLKHGKSVSQIRIFCEKIEEEKLGIVYEDNGEGIPADLKPRLFNEGCTSGKGSGYGLFLIKKAVEVYGWTVSEEGEPGKGVRFVMALPRMGRNGKADYRFS
jgi:PAS domain S-box-containing protein